MKCLSSEITEKNVSSFVRNKIFIRQNCLHLIITYSSFYTTMKRLPILLLLFSISLFIGCGDNSSDPTYEVILVNTFNSELDIYVTTGEDTETFENIGTIGSLGEFTVDRLNFNTEYIIRTVQVGNDESNFVTQHRVNNEDDSVVELTITIEF